MPFSFATGGAPYKGIFFLLLIFIILEYFFNTISNTKPILFYGYNSTRLPVPSALNKESQNYGPLLKTLIFKNTKLSNSKNNTTPNNTNVTLATNLTTISLISSTLVEHTNMDNLNYIVTRPPYLNYNGNISNYQNNMKTTKNENNNNSSTLYYVSTTGQKGENYSGTVLSSYSNNEMPMCPDISQTLYGRISVEKYSVPTVQELERRFSPWLKLGGHWSPENCKVEKKLAIVIPFRCRGEHLLLFLQHMHPFLKTQQLDYTIFIVEQDGNATFNRAMLMNIGYIEALKLRTFDCFIFHDVDLLPEDNRNLYTCPEQPRHMSVAVDMFNYRLPYPAIFGGVSAISTEHFKLLNGFSNSFWGWGGEDDDMSNRIRYHHLYISRYPLSIARYTMLGHEKDVPSPDRYDVLKQGQKKFDKDGLNSLKYEVSQLKQNLLYTWILVKIEKPR